MEEINELKRQLGRRLKVEKNFNEELHEKDLEIQELLDYKKQWYPSKFANLEEHISSLEKEKASLKAKYKQKLIINE